MTWGGEVARYPLPHQAAQWIGGNITRVACGSDAGCFVRLLSVLLSLHTTHHVPGLQYRVVPAIHGQVGGIARLHVEHSRCPLFHKLAVIGIMSCPFI